MNYSTWTKLMIYPEIYSTYADSSTKELYRETEKCLLKLTAISSHLSFNEMCLNNRLLPIFKSVRLHDEAARGENFVNIFREDLNKSEIIHQIASKATTRNEYDEAMRALKNHVTNDDRHQALMLLSKHTGELKLEEVPTKHTRKLVNLFTGPILLKRELEYFINLSDVIVDPKIKEAFSLDYNYHLKSKFDKIKYKVKIELLYESIRDKARENKVSVSNEKSLKSELERIAKKNINNHTSNLLPKKQCDKIKEFTNKPEIIVRKADKSNTFVILNTSFYQEQLNAIISDPTKFGKVDHDSTNELNRELNKLITVAKKTEDPVTFPKI